MKGRLFAQLRIGQNEVQALVDTGASDNFLRLEEAQKLGITFSGKSGWLKAVNSKPTPTHGVAANVNVRIGEWTGLINFSVVSMDDYSCVLGMDFMDRVRAIPIPFANSLCIVEDKGACTVPLRRGRAAGSTLSALQLAKGVRKLEPTFLVALQAENNEQSGVVVPHEKSESTGATPFEIVTGQQPLTPHTVMIPYRGPNPSAFKFAKGWKETVELAKVSLARATKKMKKWADSRRRHVEFTEGDMVLVRMFSRIHGKRHKGLLRKYEGPFMVEQRIGKVAYRLRLPAHLECHPMFHVSLLKPYHADEEDPARNKSKRAPVAITRSFEHEPEEILMHRVVPQWGAHPGYTEYLVRWKGRAVEETSWEHELSLWQHEELLKRYQREAMRALPD
ncbi:hypothetical protein GH714_021001 [Hevea brasiliensis]|uniref:Chromo domain-containing protein n=1 Tax=Hevea brasiliensis TaxID=3981 RepID=A0A6A6KCK7_HEVBR|nr:hypothetical protein GH714_021001 [Hevea brasiliensis]